MMSDIEAPLTPIERLSIAALYARLALSASQSLTSPAARLASQNRSVPGRLGSERSCYADLNICSPESLSHKKIPATRAREGIETC